MNICTSSYLKYQRDMHGKNHAELAAFTGDFIDALLQSLDGDMKIDIR